jgi:SAM-dependent methyltransferase
MPTDWELRYQTGDMPWEKGEPNPALLEFLEQHRLEGRVLVPGCGYGHDVRAIAQAGAAEVVGLDLAPSAIAGAQAWSADRADRIKRPLPVSFELGDFFALPPRHQGAFDWLFEHTCFCAIDPAMRGAYARSAAAALKPGGHYLAIFYMNPDMDPGETGPPFGSNAEDLDALFGEAFELERVWTPTRGYAGRVGREAMRLYRRK